MRNFAPLALLLVALLASSCCAGARGDDLGFIGSAPAEIAGTGAAETAVQSALRQLVEHRIYDTGMFMQWACSKSNKSKLLNGPATTYFENGERTPGSGQGADVYYTLQFALPEGQLTVRFVYNHAQHLIYEVRVPSEPALSVTSIPADCTFTGTLAAQSVDLTFKQQINGKRLDTFQGNVGTGFW